MHAARSMGLTRSGAPAGLRLLPCKTSSLANNRRQSFCRGVPSAIKELRGHKVKLFRGISTHVHASKSSTSITAVQSDFDLLRPLSVIRAKNGETVPLISVFQNYGQDHVCLLPFLTHFADLSSWEYAKKLKAILPQVEAAGVQVVVVGLGSRQNAMLFSKLLDFPLRLLYADPEGICYKALGFSRGFAPDATVSAYLKLLPMLAGIGSPGTIQEVVRGYVGDRSSQPVWGGRIAFDILGTGYQRPFELATLRLNHMVNILPRWGALSPPNSALLTQQGGTLLFKDETTLFRQDDSGILKYTSLTDLTAAIAQAKQSAIKVQSQV